MSETTASETAASAMAAAVAIAVAGAPADTEEISIFSNNSDADSIYAVNDEDGGLVTAKSNSRITVPAAEESDSIMPGAYRVAGIDSNPYNNDDEDYVVSNDIESEPTSSSRNFKRPAINSTPIEVEAELADTSDSQNEEKIRRKIIQQSAMAVKISITGGSGRSNFSSRSYESNERKAKRHKMTAIWAFSLCLCTGIFALIITLVLRSRDSRGSSSSTNNGATGGDSNNDVKFPTYGDRWIKYGKSRLFASTGGSDFGESIDFNKDATRLAIGANRIMNDKSGAVEVMEHDINSNEWYRLGNRIINPLKTPEFGGTVQLNDMGNVLVVGAYGNEDFYGSVSSFQYDGTSDQWLKISVSIQGIEVGDRFGWSLSMASKKLTWIAGATRYEKDGNRDGYAQVYEMQGSGEWAQKGSTIFGKEGSEAGRAVAMSGDGGTICVSDHKYKVTDTFQPGRVRCYNWSSSENDWKLNGLQTGGLLGQVHNGILGPIDGEHFGYSLALNDDGTILAVGSSRLKQAGTVRVYKLNTTYDQWEQQGQGFTGEKGGDRLGHKVALNGHGNVLAFTSRFYDIPGKNNTGIVKLRRWDDYDDEWIQMGDGDLPGESGGDHYGEAVTLSNDGMIMASSANWADVEYVSCYKLQ